MVLIDGPTQRLGHDRTSVRPPNRASGLYRSSSAAANSRPVREFRSPVNDRVRRLRVLAGEGRLASAVAAATGADQRELRSAAYDVVWPIVYARLTYRVEQRRGHSSCMAGVAHLSDECLDGFHDDVEAVVEDVLSNARQPVVHLEAWIAGRINAATVDAHRRRRGARGALQRPRMPGWLATALGEDRWLTTLATQILTWVGVRHTAGNQTWPVEVWAQDRARLTGDWRGSDPARVARDIEIVLAAMRRRPAWFESYVERPLGMKQAPVATRPIGNWTGAIAVPLNLGDPYARVEDELWQLAADAVEAISGRRGNGEDTREIVMDVVRKVFGGAIGSLPDRAPHEAADPAAGVSGALADQATVDRIVAAVRSMMGDRGTGVAGVSPA